MSSNKFTSTVCACIVICLVARCAALETGLGRGTQRSLLQDRRELKVGIRAVANPPFRDCEDPDSCKGFDPDLARAICEEINADCSFVFLSSLEERITSLENDTVDFVMDSFSVTEKRKERIDFINPFYYAAGATLFVNEQGATITGWEDIEGEDVCILKTYFVLEELRNDWDPNFLEFDTNDERDLAFTNGDCVALVSDNVDAGHGGEPVGNILFEQPFGIGIKKGRKELEVLLAGGLVEIMDDGDESLLLKKEADDLVPAGIEALPDLARLVEAISNFG